MSVEKRGSTMKITFCCDICHYPQVYYYTKINYRETELRKFQCYARYKNY